MRYFRFILLTILLPLFTMGQQNLVLNGSFEESLSCPPMDGQWTLVSDWTSPNQKSPDYFHSCAPVLANYSANAPNNISGWQQPFDGDAYMGIVCHSKETSELREYLQTELTHSLTAGIRYVAQFYTSAANRYQYAISTLGLALTNEPPIVISVGAPDGMLDAQPQVLQQGHVPMLDTAKWVLISDTVLATGGERYLTIGNFHLDGESDTVRFNPNQPPIYGSPTTFAYYYIDDVSVIAIDSVPSGVGIDETEELSFSVYPNPATVILHIKSAKELVGVRVLDMRGRSVYTENIASTTFEVDLKRIQAGIYILEVTDKKGRSATQRIIKTDEP